jgi:hypothetical protein
MRHTMIAIFAASAVSFGLAQAAPGFGASSHRLGGGSGDQKSERHHDSLGWLEALLAFAGVDPSASVEPVAGETLGASAKQCDKQKKTEVAKADDKEATKEGAGSTKGRARTGEPVYLAF